MNHFGLGGLHLANGFLFPATFLSTRAKNLKAQRAQRENFNRKDR